MSAEAAFVRTWPVGRWTATLSVPSAAFAVGQPVHAVVEWSPAIPGRPLTPSELKQYRAGREAAFADLARTKGLVGLTMELGRGLATPSTPFAPGDGRTP